MEIQIIKSKKSYRRLGLTRRIILTLALLSFASGVTRADGLAIGLFSFDASTSAGTTPPTQGTNAFDIFNYTGPTFGAFLGAPFASDSLTFENASIVVTPAGGPPETIELGNIAPGELLDANGNPFVQFSDLENFASATFTATLSPTTFNLSNGSRFVAAGALSANLTPASGSLLQADTDYVVIYAQPVPEPSVLTLLTSTTAGLLWVFLRQRRSG